MKLSILVLPGDGIGPEVTRQAVAVLSRVAAGGGFDLELGEDVIGGASIDAHGTALRPSVVERARAADAVLLGAVGGPKWDDPKATVRPEQALLGLRKELGLYANLRPVRVFAELADASTLKREVVEGVDLVVVRELTGGIYFGKPSERRQGASGREAVDTMPYTEEEVRRLMRSAFDVARLRRKKVASVDKANILSTSRLWREVAGEVAREYPDVAFEHVLVDAMAMHLIRRPRDFDVIATENMFGDILTDEAAMLSGSMGLLPSASLGEERNRAGKPRGLYEPIHGSAPDIAGGDKANPLATILSAAMMLRISFGLDREAARIEGAVSRVLAEGWRTPDIAEAGGRAIGCSEMGRKVSEAAVASAS
ncbi:MAG: 3-isopropylmalate dehydrogenase [Candidatus Binatia bacterium]